MFNVFKELCSRYRIALLVFLSIGIASHGMVLSQVWSPDCSNVVAQQRWVASYFPVIGVPSDPAQIGHSVEQISATAHGNNQNGYLFAGQTSFYFLGAPPTPLVEDFYFVMANRDGSIYLEGAVGGPQDDVCNSAVEYTQVANPADHGIIGVGYTESYGPQTPVNQNILITQTNNILVPQQSWAYGTADRDEIANKIKAVSPALGGGFIVVGSSNGAPNDNAYVIRLDAAGAFQWELLIDDSHNEYLFDVAEFNDGVQSGFVLAGYRHDTGLNTNDLWAMWIDNVGNILNYRRYHSFTNDLLGYSVQPVSNGSSGYVFAGAALNSGQSDAFVIRTDVNGDLTWAQTYGPNTSNELAREIRWTPSPAGGDQFVIVGDWNDQPAGDMFFAALDATGGILRAQALGQPATREQGFGIEQSDDGGFVTVGSTEQPPPNRTQVYAQKLDCNLDNDCQTAEIDPPVVELTGFGTAKFFFGSTSTQLTVQVVNPLWDVESHEESIACRSVDPDPSCCFATKPTYQSNLMYLNTLQETGYGLDRGQNGEYYVFGDWDVPTNNCTNNFPRNHDATASVYGANGQYQQTFSFGGQFDDGARAGKVFHTDASRSTMLGTVLAGYNQSAPWVTMNQNEDAYAVWFDPSTATVISEMKFGGEEADRFHDVRQVFDEQNGNHFGFVFTGYTRSFHHGTDAEVYTVFLDASLTVVFATYIGGANDDIGWSVTPVYNFDGSPDLDGFAVVGETASFGPGPRAIYYLLLTPGGMLMANPVTFGGANDDVGYSIQEVSDHLGDGLVIAGEVNSHNGGVQNDMFVFRIDYNGNYLETGGGTSIRHVYGGAGNDGARQIIFDNDNCGTDYVVAGYTNSFQQSPSLGENSYLAKIDERGAPQWQWAYGPQFNDRSFDVIRNMEGGYSMAGFWQVGINDNNEQLITTACDGTTKDHLGQPCFYLAAPGSAPWLSSQRVVPQLHSPMYVNNAFIPVVPAMLEVGACNSVSQFLNCYFVLNPNKEAQELLEAATFDDASASQLQVQPNPLQRGGELRVELNVDEAGAFTFVLRDLLGREQLRLQRSLGAGHQSLALPVAGLSPGSYTVELLRNARRLDQSLLIVR